MKLTFVLILFLAGLSQAMAQGAPTMAMSPRDEMDARFSQVIRANLDHAVVLEDILGEGAGQWDDEPRYPQGKVNCMTWLQLLLAETYSSKDPASKMQIMDRVRYYAGIVTFATRKHFTDQWLMLEPEPLKAVPLSACRESVSRHTVDLKPNVFTKHQGYSCPLYKGDVTHHSFEFVKLDGFDKCADRLKPGHYVLFAVPTEKFLARAIDQTGPMGLVHAMVLEVPYPSYAHPGARATKKPVIFHASTAGKHVLMEGLEEFLRKSKTIHQGYAIYELDPTWSVKTAPRLVADPGLPVSFTCEKTLPKPRKKVE